MANTVYYQELTAFCAKVMEGVGCNAQEAALVAKVLVEANARGIHSHGVARLKRYVDHIKQGMIEPNQVPEVIFETPLTAVIDGNHGVGQTVGEFAMQLTLQKAQATGIGMVTVRNSNHYGIAGYYAEQALEHDMLGFSFTNTAPLVVPTFGKHMLLGTSPIAAAIPTAAGDPILIDMATSVVARGKLELYDRLSKELPLGWATDENGVGTQDPARVLQNMTAKAGGGLLPLGGEGEMFSGHKGYGLALLIEVLTAGLSLGSYSYETYQGKGKVAHAFAAIRMDLFGDPAAIKAHITKLVENLKNSDKAAGAERIYIHGEKEYARKVEALQNGIVLDDKTIAALQKLAAEYKVALQLAD